MFEEIQSISKILKDLNIDWYIAGGWANDLYLGKKIRDHSDVEIAIARTDQLVLKKYLDTPLHKVINGKLSLWEENEYLELPIHEIHSNNFEILLNEFNDQEWIYRRDDRIHYPLNKFSIKLKNGLKIISPEVVLLYKSKNTKPKDDLDFNNVVDHMKTNSKTWLADSIRLSNEKHPWLKKL